MGTKKKSSVKDKNGAHVVLHRLLKTTQDCKGRKKPPKEVNKVQAVLLSKRTQDAPVHPGYWGLMGGTQEPHDKTPKHNAAREVTEELEVIGMTKTKFRNRIMKAKELCVQPIDHGNGKVDISYFELSLKRDMSKLRLKPNKKRKVEGEGLGWFTAEETHHLVMRPEDRVAVDRFFKKYGV